MFFPFVVIAIELIEIQFFLNINHMALLPPGKWLNSAVPWSIFLIMLFNFNIQGDNI